jgi:FlaA1/EpsC-like NDP-sugar epimerase
MHKLPIKLLSFLAFFHDAVVVMAAWWLAFALRFNFHIPPEFSQFIWQTLPIIFLFHAISFYTFGLYKGVWRFASLPDLKRIMRAIGFAALMSASYALFTELGKNVAYSTALR